MCVYVVLDVGSGVSDGETLDIKIDDPSTEVTVSTGTVAPNTPMEISGSTYLVTLPAYVKSVEYVEIQLGSGTASASTDLAKGQDINNCVPFDTQMHTGMSDDFDDTLLDIYFESSPIRVTAVRRAAGDKYRHFLLRILSILPDIRRLLQFKFL